MPAAGTAMGLVAWHSQCEVLLAQDDHAGVTLAAQTVSAALTG